MSTINSKKIVDDFIKSNGFFEDDPQVHMIVEYENAYGGVCWGITWINEPLERRQRYLDQTEFIRNPRVIWHRNGD